MKAAFPWMAGLSLAMSVLWGFRYRKVGKRALVMSVAFVLMGFLAWGFGEGWPVGVLVGFGIGVFGCLVVDMATRSAERVDAGGLK